MVGLIDLIAIVILAIKLLLLIGIIMLLIL